MLGIYRSNRPRPRHGFQLYSWYFFRVSGVLLILFALGHIFFTHYLILPSQTTSDFVSGRWGQFLGGMFWRTFDWFLLTLALIHGLNGLQLSVDDYIHNRNGRLAATTVLFAVGYAFVAVGTLTLMVFTASPGTASAQPSANDPMWIASLLEYALYAIGVVTYVGTVITVIWLLRHWQNKSLYWGGWGQPAWLFHRLTGWGILFFLFIHILDIAVINVSPAVYDQTIRAYANPFLFPMEIGLVGALLYHALNGVRIIAFDVSIGALRKQQMLFGVIIIATIILMAPSAVLLLTGR